MARYQKLKIICDSTCRIPDAHLPGRSKKGKAACGILFLDENEDVVKQMSFYPGELTPPQAEYRGVIKALDAAAGFCRGEIEIWLDSEFVVKQLNGDYGIKSENMKPLYDEVKTLERRFLSGVVYYHHPRIAKLAKQADRLANMEINKRLGP